ncbi:hypothetical protein B0H17DRAFT_1140557 [Mycena rosella]|uniref:Uncharacterized protein n=1 Tax=Mycena rosella TaxID=1033263 RepID=A0AAD7D5E3_MYCRO|nr:hypothetical protein B0H17DRAFT_1140557 [Mycena rosella]
MRFSAEDLQIINEALEEIRAIDQEAAEEEFEEMEVRHGVSPSVDPRESDEVNDETDSDKEFAGKQSASQSTKRKSWAFTLCRERKVSCSFVNYAHPRMNKRKGEKTWKSEVGSRKAPKAKAYHRHREERSPEGSSESEVEPAGVPIRNTRIDDLRGNQRHLNSVFERMLRREGEREVQISALELTLRAILDGMREQFPMPAEQSSWLRTALKTANFFESVPEVEGTIRARRKRCRIGGGEEEDNTRGSAGAEVAQSGFGR